MLYYFAPVNTDDPFSRYCIGTQLKFVWLPKRCHFTDKLLWLKYAYVQTAMYTGPGDAIFEERWYDKNEFILEKIKGTV